MLGVLSVTSVGICSPLTPCGALWRRLVSKGGQRRQRAPQRANVQNLHVVARADAVSSVEAAETAPANTSHGEPAAEQRRESAAEQKCESAAEQRRESAAEQRPIDEHQQEATPTLFFCIATPNTSMVEAGRDSAFLSWYSSIAEGQQQPAPDCGAEGRAETGGGGDGHAGPGGSGKEPWEPAEEEEHSGTSISLAHKSVEKGIDAPGCSLCSQTPQAWESFGVRILGRSGKFYTIEVADARIAGAPAPARSIGRRYREFHRLDRQLRPRLPQLPELPPKSLFFRKNFKPGFLCKREEGLGEYVAALVANPAAVQDAAVRLFLGFEDETDIPAG